jgi:hypothetical protein
MKNVLKDLQDHSIDFSQMAELKADHCEEAESSTA